MNLTATEKALDEQLAKLIPSLAVALLVIIFGSLIFSARSYTERPASRVFGQDGSSCTQTGGHAPQKVLRAADYINDGKHHLLLAATGSVATIKLPNIVDALSQYPNLSIRILLSDSAANFLQSQSHEQPSLSQISRMKNVDGIYRDEDEWRKPWVRGDSILHIELRRWADIMVIAPLSANSLAKIAGGVADNLITSVARAWDTTGVIDAARQGVPLPYWGKKVIVVAPAMNTAMWAHPVTGKHIEILASEWGIDNGGWMKVLRPVEKELACGDTGSGAMRDWREIARVIEERLGLLSPIPDDATNGTAKPG